LTRKKTNSFNDFYKALDIRHSEGACIPAEKRSPEEAGAPNPRPPLQTPKALSGGMINRAHPLFCVFLIMFFVCSVHGPALIVGAPALASTAAPALVNTAPINLTGANRYKAVRLTPAVYNAANTDLSDLLIKDSKNDNTPYFIHRGFQSVASSRDSYKLELINSYLKDDSFYFDYKLAAERSADTISTSLEFTTRVTNFAKAIELYGSYDNINWAFIQKDTIYSIDNKSKLMINFASPQKFTHFRLKLANNLEQISFSSASLVYSVETSGEIYFIESLEPAYSAKNVDKTTEITIEGLKNLRLCDITIHTDSMFKRNVRTSHGASKELFNLTLNDTTYSDTSIPLYWQVSANDTYTLTINNADDKPIEVKGLTARYFADELVFEAKANETYTLEFGSDPAKRAPVYDIERYKNEILKGEIDKATLGAISSAAPKAPSTNYKLIFNIVIIVITLLLGTVIILRLKKSGAE